ncbi:MAG: fatty acid desaturase [Pirellulaceae bacterium]|nr:fatty acid desaturase [Pirellulaceae bacterium]
MSAEVPSWISTARATLQNSSVDFFRVQPLRYWADFLLSIVLAYTAASIYMEAPAFSAIQVVAFLVAIFWLYRLGSLVHEVCHLGHREMRTFKVVWNLAVGVITLAPSPFYTRHHRDHHSQRLYGTVYDPEYVINVFRPGSVLSLLGYAVLIAAYPLIVWLRFALAPLTFLHPKLREWALTRASSLTMNWRYERRLNAFDRWAVTTIELLCCLRAIAILAFVLAGVTHWSRIPLMYSLALGVLVLNQMRQLADHHFVSDGGQMNLPDHIRDSCNYTSRDFFTWLFFPFSIRYHALHHLFPTLPYHNLKAAHNYLVEHLPADSPYRQLDQPSWWSVARRTLWSTPSLAAVAGPAVAEPTPASTPST